MTRPRFLPDNFTLTLIGVVVLASLLPASGQVAVGFGWLTNLAIALLFFLLTFPFAGSITNWIRVDNTTPFDEYILYTKYFIGILILF